MPVGTEEEIRQPSGIFLGHVNDRKIEHVDHAPVQPASIATTIGEQSGYLLVGTLIENASVKHTIDDVAHRARRDEGKAEYHAELGVFPCQAADNDEQRDDRYNTEQAQNQLHDTTTAHPAEGHTLVLDEQQLEPVPHNGNLRAQSHVRFDPNLKDLVQEQDNEHHHKRPHQAVVAGLFHRFFSLASRQRVVMGTQRSLSLGMSLPVSQQMP